MRPTTAAGDAEPTLPSIVGSMATAIEKGLSPGDVAALRRLCADDVPSAPYWRLLAMHPELARGTPSAQDAMERDWICILQAMARMAGLHDPSRPLGRVLAEADLAEQRLLRLLRASGPALHDAIRVTSHYLSQKALSCSHLDIAQLVLSDGHPWGERVRRRIARSYYSQLGRETSQ